MAENNSDALVALVDREAPFLAFTADNKRVICTLNNHELPARTDAVEAFVKYVTHNRSSMHVPCMLLGRVFTRSGRYASPIFYNPEIDSKHLWYTHVQGKKVPATEVPEVDGGLGRQIQAIPCPVRELSQHDVLRANKPRDPEEASSCRGALEGT